MFCNFNAFLNGKGFGLKVDRSLVDRVLINEPELVDYDETGLATISADAALKYSRTRSETDHKDCYACVHRLSAGAAQREFDFWDNYSDHYVYFNGKCMRAYGEEDERVLFFDALTMSVHTVAEAQRYQHVYAGRLNAHYGTVLAVTKDGDLVEAEEGDEPIIGLNQAGFPIYSKVPVETEASEAFHRLQKGNPVYRHDNKFWTNGHPNKRVCKWVITTEWETDVRQVLTLADGTIDMP